ncbi:hypothetical protein [Azospirillum argentinense]|nr:hypothetical protein [Azospirillum argentinense]
MANKPRSDRAITLASRWRDGISTVEALVPAALREALEMAFPGEKLARAVILASAAHVGVPLEAVAPRKAGRPPKAKPAMAESAPAIPAPEEPAAAKPLTDHEQALAQVLGGYAPTAGSPSSPWPDGRSR